MKANVILNSSPFSNAVKQGRFLQNYGKFQYLNTELQCVITNCNERVYGHVDNSNTRQLI